MEYILIFISAIFVNNIVLSQFLGICPFLGVSKKVDTALGMSAAVAFVLTLATIVTFLVQKLVLDVFGLQYIQEDYNVLEGIVYALSTAIGFGLAMTVFAGMREQLEMVNIPKGMRGMAIVLVSAGLLSLAFMGFSGVDGGLKQIFGLE